MVHSFPNQIVYPSHAEWEPCTLYTVCVHVHTCTLYTLTWKATLVEADVRVHVHVPCTLGNLL